MNADSFYTIGSTHAVCQDYALSVVTENSAFAIVSDGCSSAPDTDWGARLLAKSAEIALRRGGGVVQEAFKAADLLRYGLELDSNSLLATLGWILLKDTSFESCLFGDGNFVARSRKTGKLRVVTVEFTSGGPYYLKYAFTAGDREDYLKKLGWGKYVITTIEDGVVQQTQELSVEEGCGGWVCRFPREDYDLVAVITDGLSHFTQKVQTPTSITKNSVKIDSVLQEVMAFKGYAGSFVRRRCHKAFAKFKELGYTNEDDFGIGVVYDG
jgi:hypothetical protein